MVHVLQASSHAAKTSIFLNPSASTLLQAAAHSVHTAAHSYKPACWHRIAAAVHSSAHLRHKSIHSPMAFLFIIKFVTQISNEIIFLTELFFSSWVEASLSCCHPSLHNHHFLVCVFYHLSFSWCRLSLPQHRF